MKFLLVGINSKYIHSNPAIYSLRQYAVKVGKIPSENICLSEYTINELPEMILRDIYEKKCDVCMFSVYIWNVAYVKRISRELKEISPVCNNFADRAYFSLHVVIFFLTNDYKENCENSDY